MKRRFADLFCGIGGFHFAAVQQGWTPVFASEIDPHAARQYEAATGFTPHGDITKVDKASIPDHDLLLAGFPCQPFSIIGKREGLADARGGLIHEIAWTLRIKQPAAFVLENVKQLVTHDGGRTFREVCRLLSGVGYTICWTILDARNFGLPQKRERVFIVGFRDPKAAARFRWPAESLDYPFVSDILEEDPDPSLTLSPAMREKLHSKLRMQLAPYKGEFSKVLVWHQNKGGNISTNSFSCALRAGASYSYLTVGGERRLSGREMLRLQGFPEEFPICGSYSQIRKQCGNAVAVPVVEAIIEEVDDALSEG